MNRKKLKKRHIVLLTVIFTLGILLSISLAFYSDSAGDVYIPPVLQYLIIAFVVALPLLLLALLVILRVMRSSRPAPIIMPMPVPATVDTPVKVEEIDSSGNKDKDYIDDEGDGSDDDEDEQRVNNSGKRFFSLSEIDNNISSFRRHFYNNEITLKQLCDNFRAFAASELKLYYDISDIRKFIAGLAVSHIIILQGISGTGKTSLAYAFGEYLDNPSTVVPVQPMWKERSDLIGYYNEFTKRFNETILLQKLYEANYAKDMYISVLDEMNIARIEYYFAEFLSLLELPNPEKRFLTVVSDKWDTDPLQLVKGQIKLPDNMWFIGTSNNDDTTFSISDKVYDRAMVLNLDYKSDVFTASKTPKLHITADRFKQLTKAAACEYSMTRRNIKRLEILDKYLIETYGITFGNRIRKQILTFIPVYIACGGDELEALDDILVKKLMRKLEMQNPVYLRNSGGGFIEKINELFGDDKMLTCKAYITRLTKNA